MKIQFSALFCVIAFTIGCGPDTDSVNDATGDESSLDQGHFPDLSGCEPCVGQPCGYHWKCVSQTRYASADNYVDECRCVNGCANEKSGDCPDGTLCYSESWREETGIADQMPCRGNECNPDDGLGCPKGTFCDTLPGICGGPGICNHKWGDHLFESGEVDWTYTCGCDGVTHTGVLQRLEAGAAVAHEGQCCVPERLDLDALNTARHTLWTACATKDAVEGLPADLSEMVRGARFGEHGYTMGCAENDVVYMGDITLSGDGAVDPGQYDRLCRLASFPGFYKVGGHAADYCDTACWTGLECGDTDCPSICGCCACETGKKRCFDVHSHTVCSSKGCWTRPDQCAIHSACVQDGDDVRCEPSCDVMLDVLRTIAIAGGQVCNEYTTCQAIAGLCDRADGPCWVPWNGSDLSGDMTGLKEHWLTEGCWNQEACGCEPAPAAACVDERCELIP